MQNARRGTVGRLDAGVVLSLYFSLLSRLELRSFRYQVVPSSNASLHLIEFPSRDVLSIKTRLLRIGSSDSSHSAISRYL